MEITSMKENGLSPKHTEHPEHPEHPEHTEQSLKELERIHREASRLTKKSKHRLGYLSANTMKIYAEVERSIHDGEVIKIIDGNIQCNEKIGRWLKESRAKDKGKLLREICSLVSLLSKEVIIEVYNNTDPFRPNTKAMKKRTLIEISKDVYMICKADNYSKLTFKLDENSFNKIVERYLDKDAKQSEKSLVREIVRDDFRVVSSKACQASLTSQASKDFTNHYIIVPNCNRRTCLIRVEKQAYIKEIKEQEDKENE